MLIVYDDCFYVILANRVLKIVVTDDISAGLHFTITVYITLFVKSN